MEYREGVGYPMCTAHVEEWSMLLGRRRAQDDLRGGAAHRSHGMMRLPEAT